jgi:hypothetical protein
MKWWEYSFLYALQQNKASRPEADYAALTVLLACLLCFVPATSACFSECVFAVANNSFNQTNKAGGT